MSLEDSGHILIAPADTIARSVADVVNPHTWEVTIPWRHFAAFVDGVTFGEPVMLANVSEVDTPPAHALTSINEVDLTPFDDGFVGRGSFAMAFVWLRYDLGRPVASVMRSYSVTDSFEEITDPAKAVRKYRFNFPPGAVKSRDEVPIQGSHFPKLPKLKAVIL